MRRRLVASIAGVATVAVLLLAVPLGVVLGRGYRDEELLRLQRDTIASTRSIDVDVSRGDPIELPPTTDVLAVYDRSGLRVAGRGPATAPSLVREVLRRAQPADAKGQGALEVAIPLLRNERITGAVRAQRPDAAAQRDARDAWLVLGAIALGIIAVATIAAVVLSRRLAGPLERMAAAARRLGDGDFSVRAPVAGIAEVDAVGTALDTTAQRLDDLVTRERAFSADASHQLRTPLQALRIELEAIELRGEAPVELPAALAQVDRLQSTVDTVLAVARDAPRNTSVTDLRGVLREIDARWHGSLAQAGRPFRITCEERELAVRAAAPVVREILEVLVDNAAKHGRGAVTVDVRDVEAYTWVDVADEGPGFAVDLDQAFARRAGSGQGHGIGLSLARSLAHAEGGRVTVTHMAPKPIVSLVLPRVDDSS
ncbi:MAG: HAMP domain-containing histidine kinase [Actinomycetota bacterium]|nr:HAMP domain-containing histidine kinase [Actinomycetota bacterium]